MNQEWNTQFDFEITGEKELEIEIMDKEVVGNDKFMGRAKINILDWIAVGSFDGTIETEDKSGKHAGKIQISAKFKRTEIHGLSTAQTLKTSMDLPGKSNLPKAQRDPNGEFTNDEIYQAFHSFDLDNNNYVGAAEIRHVLVNIGERVTDEEVRYQCECEMNLPISN